MLDIRYEDFFAPPQKDPRKETAKRERLERKKRRLESDEEDYYSEEAPVSETTEKEPQKEKPSLLEDEQDSTHLSTFEKQQQAMSALIQDLEEEIVAEKSWTMTGETGAKQRPKNSLLEEDLDVDFAKKLAPVITEETTQTLEEMIIQRIKEGAFDDVERKAAPKEFNFDPNRRIELNDEKSSKSLAQEYEEEFLKQTQKGIKTEKDQKLEKEHVEIEGLMQNLFSSLDALSNWHFTPKPLKAELEILPAPSVPAIVMEEALPVAENMNATVLAPQEVYKGKIDKGDAEKTSTDKKRERSKKKRIAKRIHEEKQLERKQKEKMAEEQGKTLSNMASKSKALEELKKHSNVTIIGDKSIAKKKRHQKPSVKAEMLKL